MSISTQEALYGIDALLSLVRLLDRAGVNAQEVITAQKRAEEEGRKELSEAERLDFIGQAQSALDRL